MISKTLQVTDYKQINVGLGKAVQGMAACYGIGQKLYIPHDHRHWEYGSCIQAILEHKFPTSNYPIDVLDIGCGDGFLGPAIAMLGNNKVNEIEIDEKIVIGRSDLGAKLKIPLTINGGSILELKNWGKFDIVTCISVIEHIPRSKLWDVIDNLSLVVKPGGMLFITTDVGEGQEWYNHRERETHFDMEDIQKIVLNLVARGFAVSFDHTYGGNEVKNYTFMRIIGYNLNV